MPNVYRVRRAQLRSLQFFIIAVAFISASLSPSYRLKAQPAAAKTPLTHETMWMMKRVDAPVSSPDGKWVVFSLIEPAYEEKDQCRIFGLSRRTRVRSRAG